MALGVKLGVGVALGVIVAVAVAAAVAVAVGLAAAVGVGDTDGVGVGVVACPQYLPPVFKRVKLKVSPPQTIISLPVQTAV